MTEIEDEEKIEEQDIEEPENWDEEQFPAFYQGIKVHNPQIGIISKPSVFHDTVESYGKIVKKEFGVELNTYSTDGSENISWDRQDSNKLIINIPAEGTKIIKDEGQLLEWYLKRPIFRLLAKSDDRNRQKIYDKLHSDGVINYSNFRGTDKVLDTVYNLVEYYRCENQQGRIFIGSKQDIDDIYSRIPEKEATNQLETLINMRCGREDLIPEQFKEDARFYKNELRKVEGTSAVGTMIATRNIVTRIVQKTKQEEPEPEPEPQEGDEQGEGQGQGEPQPEPQKEEKDDENKQEEPKEEDSDEQEQEQESDKSDEQDGEQEQDSEDKQDEQENSEQEQDSEEQKEDSEKSQDSEQKEKPKEKTDSEIGRDLQKEVQEATQGKETLGLDRNNYGSEQLKTTQARIDWDKPEQEILDKAKSEGERQLTNIRKVFEKIALEEKEKILKKLQETKIDSELPENYREVLPVTSDKALVSRLVDTFARIKTRRVFNTADSGIRVNIDNYIRRYAGDDKVKLFERHDLDSGLDIAYVIDCSGSMGSGLTEKDRYSDDQTKWKIYHAKSLLKTMTEATKNLRNVNNTIFAYGYSTDSANIIKYGDIDKLFKYGQTPSHIGLYQALKHLKKTSSRNRKLVVHITDGGPDDSNLTEFVVSQIKQQGIEIHTILLADNSDDENIHETLKHYERTYGGKANFTQIDNFDKVRQLVSTTVAKRIFEILA